MSAPRRRKGEGSVGRWHREQEGCPPVDPTTGERPDHKCTARYRARVWVVAHDGTRVRKTVYGLTEREVLRKVKDLTVEEAQRTLLGTRAMKVGEWLDQWLEECEASNDYKPNTLVTYRGKINTYLKPHLGKHRLDKLTDDHVTDFYAALRRQGLSSSTVRLCHGILSKALRVAERRGKVARNVCRLVEPPKVGKRSPKRGPMTVEEAQRVLEAAGEDARWWVALLTGMRQGECLALRWRDVHLDVENGEVHPYLVVRQSLSYVTSVGFVFDTPKSDASTDREVPLVPPLAARLRLARDRAFTEGATDDSLVFPNPRKRDTPLYPNQDYRNWQTILDRAKVERRPLHTARNTAAALLELAGVSPRVVAQVLGHTHVDMTFHYQQGNRVSLGLAAGALTEYLEGLGGSRGHLTPLEGGKDAGAA
jgi:integrase